MPRFITNIQAVILSNYVGNLTYFTGIQGTIQTGDYINVNNWIGYLQTFKNVSEAYTYIPPTKFGLKNQFNKPMVTIQISY